MTTQTKKKPEKTSEIIKKIIGGLSLSIAIQEHAQKIGLSDPEGIQKLRAEVLAELMARFDDLAENFAPVAVLRLEEIYRRALAGSCFRDAQAALKQISEIIEKPSKTALRMKPAPGNEGAFGKLAIMKRSGT